MPLLSPWLLPEMDSCIEDECHGLHTAGHSPFVEYLDARPHLVVGLAKIDVGNGGLATLVDPGAFAVLVLMKSWTRLARSQPAHVRRHSARGVHQALRDAAHGIARIP